MTLDFDGIYNFSRVVIIHLRICSSEILHFPIIIQQGLIMKQIDIEEYLNERVLAHIDYCDDVAYSYRTKYHLIEWVLIIVACLTPIFVILNFILAQDNLAKWIPVASSTVVAILTGGLKTFRYEDNWRKYSELAELLKKEKYQFMTGAGIYKSSSNPESVFVEAVETIIGKI